MVRFVIVGDNHGDMADPKAEKVFWEWMQDFKPHTRIHLGDAIDLRSLRRNAGNDEGSESVVADVEAGVEFLKRLRANVWLLGNHDHRIVRCIKSASDGKVRDLANFLWQHIVDAVPNTNIVPYGKRSYYQFADYRIVHGYRTGLTAARWVAADCGSNAVMGHVHTTGSFYNPSIAPTQGHTIGCLCHLDMEYNLGHPNTLRQNHGWAYGVLSRNGTKVNLFHAELDRDTYALSAASDFKEYGNE